MTEKKYDEKDEKQEQPESRIDDLSDEFVGAAFEHLTGTMLGDDT